MDRHHSHSPLVDSLRTAIGHLQVWRQVLTASTVKSATQPGVAAAWSAPSSSVCLCGLGPLHAGSWGSCRRQIVAVFSPDRQLDSIGAQALLVLAPYVIGESPCHFSCDIVPLCQSNSMMQHSSRISTFTSSSKSIYVFGDRQVNVLWRRLHCCQGARVHLGTLSQGFPAEQTVPRVLLLSKRRHPGLLAGDGLEAVLSGVVKGAGRQASAVPIVLFSYYCLGVPLSLLLGFQAGLKVWAVSSPQVA